MKRLLLSAVTSIFLLSLMFGQQPAASSSISMNFEQFQKKALKSDADIQDPKKSISPKTWYNRGELMQDIYELNGVRKSITNGMEPIAAELLLGKPKEVRTTDKGETYVYDGYELSFEAGKMVDWEQTKTIVERPLDKAYEAFLKCKELDTEGKMTKKLTEKFVELSKQYQNDGIIQYLKGAKADESKDTVKSHAFYLSAFQDFTNSVAVGELPLVNQPDTVKSVYAYYAGFCANRGKNYTDAIKYLEMARSLKLLDPAMFQLLGETYILLGDTAKGVAVVKDGIDNLKENAPLVIFLVNHYLRAGASKEALNYLAVAKSQDPANPTLHFVEGTLYDKMNDFENARNSYQKAIELDPTYFEPTFNNAALHYNRAVKMIDEALMTKDNKEYERKIAAANKELENVIPLMEKAHELSPNDRSVLDTLKNIYYRLKMEDKRKEIEEKIKSL